MADLKICSIPECGKSVYCRALCKGHYTRLWRYGDPTGGKQPAVLRAFIEMVSLIQEDGPCIEWPFGRSTNGGYGLVCAGDVKGRVSRIVCEKAHGPPPSPRHQAAHRCGNPPCIRPAHLYWATCRENMLDKHDHGTMPQGDTHWTAKRGG